MVNGAMRLLGEHLQRMEKNKGQLKVGDSRGTKTEPRAGPPTLFDLGITKKESPRGTKSVPPIKSATLAEAEAKARQRKAGGDQKRRGKAASVENDGTEKGRCPRGKALVAKAATSA